MWPWFSSLSFSSTLPHQFVIIFLVSYLISPNIHICMQVCPYFCKAIFLNSLHFVCYFYSSIHLYAHLTLTASSCTDTWLENSCKIANFEDGCVHSLRTCGLCKFTFRCHLNQISPPTWQFPILPLFAGGSSSMNAEECAKHCYSSP